MKNKSSQKLQENWPRMHSLLRKKRKKKNFTQKCARGSFRDNFSLFQKNPKENFTGFYFASGLTFENTMSKIYLNFLIKATFSFFLITLHRLVVRYILIL